MIDLLQPPALAGGEQIIAVPTLVEHLPTRVKKIIGYLNNTERVLVGLDPHPATLGNEPSMMPRRTVMLLADRRQSNSRKALRSAGYNLILSFTTDDAVALCVNRNVEAVVLDQEHFVVTDEWSVAQSLKMIKARMCVILMVRGKIRRHSLPAGVDAVVAEGDTQELLKTIKRLLGSEAA